MQEPAVTGGELSTALRHSCREGLSLAQLVELLPLHTFSTSSTLYKGAASWPASIYSVRELLLTVQPTGVLTQRKAFSSFVSLSVCVCIFVSTCVCVHLCVCIYVYMYVHEYTHKKYVFLLVQT